MADLRTTTQSFIANIYRIDKLQDSVGDGGRNRKADTHRVALALYRLGKYPGYHGDDSMPLSMRELSYRIKQFQASHDGLEQTGLVVPNDPTHEALVQYFSAHGVIIEPGNNSACGYYSHIDRQADGSCCYPNYVAPVFCNLSDTIYGMRG